MKGKKRKNISPQHFKMKKDEDAVGWFTPKGAKVGEYRTQGEGARATLDSLWYPGKTRMKQQLTL